MNTDTLNTPRQNKASVPPVSVILLLLSAGIVLFAMFVVTPMRLDDWTWGSSIGIARLESLFAGYNGRYLGNLTVIILLRLPVLVRALIQTVLVLSVFYLALRILDRSLSSVLLFVLLFFLCPAGMFSQCVTWVSGFANYFVSLVYLLLFVAILIGDIRIPDHNNAASVCLAICVILGQLYLETVTLAVPIITILVIMCKKLFEKRGDPSWKVLWIILQGAVLGAGIMFLNSSYGSAISHDGGTYKEVALANTAVGLIKNYIQSFTYTVAPEWLCEHQLLIVALSLIGFLLTFWSDNKRLARTLRVPWLVFAVFALFDLANPGWKNLTLYGDYLRAAFVVCFAFSLLLVPALKIKTLDGFKWNYLLLCQTILILPVPLASPFNSRMVFHNYVLWILLGAYGCMVLARQFMQAESQNLAAAALLRSFNVATSAGVLALVFFVFTTQLPALRIYALRDAQIEAAKTTGATSILIPEVPMASLYCYGANVRNENEYWIENYKCYYQIPEDCSIEFCSLEDFNARALGAGDEG